MVTRARAGCSILPAAARTDQENHVLPYGIHHTGYTVSDLDRSLAFYQGLLGLELVARQEKQGGYLGEIVGLSEAHVKMAHLRVPGSGHVVELFEYVAPEGGAPGRLEPENVGTSHLCLLTDDLPSLYEHLLGEGVDTFVSPPVLVDTGINTGGYGVYLRDPDGIPVELFQPAQR
jgi:catechol 2,3-dioxygenase-like lactoylglutathione lyase family enzyme